MLHPLPTQHLPRRSQTVLGVTSMWMLVPVVHTDLAITMRAALAVTCAVSVLFWSAPVDNSALHVLDKACALFVLSLLSLYSPALLTALCGLLVALLFRRACVARSVRAQLWWHVLFRFVFYHWIMVVGNSARHVWHSALYFAHIAVLQSTHDWYWAHVLTAAATMAGSSLAG